MSVRKALCKEMTSELMVVMEGIHSEEQMVNFNSERMINMVKGYDISWKLVDSMSGLGDFGRKQG